MSRFDFGGGNLLGVPRNRVDWRGKSLMTGKEINYVRDIVGTEGFEYAFIHYDDFKAVKDPEFHKLRAAYVQAHKELYDYLGLED
jgi:hypothetical protein